MVPGGHCPSEGSLKERGEEEKEKEERVEIQLAACGNRKQKQRLEKCNQILIRINRLFLVGSTV